MGLREHIDRDLSETFFSEQDFAEPAVYRPANGEEFALSVLFEDPYSEVEPGGMGSIQAQGVRVMARASAFPHPPGPGDILTVRQQAYRVITSQPDGMGVMTLTLDQEG